MFQSTNLISNRSGLFLILENIRRISQSKSLSMVKKKVSESRGWYAHSTHNGWLNIYKI